jgi:hypothetical protein
MRVNRVLIASTLVAIALAFVPLVGAQDALRVLRIVGFGGDGLQPGEATALQNLVTSYVIELKMFRVIDEGGQELALKEAETAIQLGTSKDVAPLAADYIMSAKASKIGTLIVFTMDVTKVSSGEKKSVADTFSSVNDIILAARRLTHKLFEKPLNAAADTTPAPAPPTAAPAAPAVSTNSAPSLSLVSGHWKGDKNVDRVTILPDGRGFAVLASGIRMTLKASIEGAAVVIVQNQPNSPDFYRPGLDLKSARVVAAAARPWRWVFALSSDGSSLSGVKESSFINANEKGVVSVDNGYVRDSIWKRLYHN